MSEIQTCFERISRIQLQQLEADKRNISEFEAIALLLSEAETEDAPAEKTGQIPFNYSV